MVTFHNPDTHTMPRMSHIGWQYLQLKISCSNCTVTVTLVTTFSLLDDHPGCANCAMKFNEEKRVAPWDVRVRKLSGLKYM